MHQVGNKIIHHSNIFGALPADAVPATYSFSIEHLTSMDLVETTATRDEKYLTVEIDCSLY